jgi:3-oxoacyl-[acyl-carrier protein] reductase
MDPVEDGSMKSWDPPPEQFVETLCEANRLVSEGNDVASVCQQLRISMNTYNRWQNVYEAISSTDASRLAALEKENTELKRLWEQRALPLKGKAALVTGGASGIGAATAVALASAGADVAITWYQGDPHDPNEVVEAITNVGGIALALEGDVGHTPDVERITQSAGAEFGRLDIVVANAGILRSSPTVNLQDREWNEVLDIDLGGVLRCFRAALPGMVDRRSGRLLTTTSIAGIWGWPKGVAYAAAKAGIIGLVRSLAVEVGQYGITVNAVAPGTIVSAQSLDDRNSLGPMGLSANEQKVPLRRNGCPSDVAAAFGYLASDDASYVTGHVLVIDGGLTLCPMP